MNILVIAPLPLPTRFGETAPPVTGNTLPVIVMMEDLRKEGHNVTEININPGSYASGFFSFTRAFQILQAAIQAGRAKKRSDLIYLTVAESFVGNLRDIAMYISCWRKLDRMFIHMLGGARMKLILTPSSKWQFKINRFFISRLAGVIVEGQAQFDTFTNVIDKRKIHIIPNFAENYLLNNEKDIKEKFVITNPLKVLFLSNMLYGKGHNELFEAYSRLSKELQSEIIVDFAGNFETEQERHDFKAKIAPFANLTYHGPVGGDVKKKFYHQAHIFCLPTYYPYEGQPFCIVESYAGGCAVITTNHSGISQIFTDGVNGYEVQKKSVDALTDMLELVANQRNDLVKFGLNNFKEVMNKYTDDIYLIKIKKVLKIT